MPIRLWVLQRVVLEGAGEMRFLWVDVEVMVPRAAAVRQQPPQRVLVHQRQQLRVHAGVMVDVAVMLPTLVSMGSVSGVRVAMPVMAVTLRLKRRLLTVPVLQPPLLPEMAVMAQVREILEERSNLKM
jgi:hypothetical protein